MNQRESFEDLPVTMYRLNCNVPTGLTSESRSDFDNKRKHNKNNE